jgi:hypothetical protein
VHPTTRRRYRWVRGSILTYHAVDLVHVEQAQASAFRDAADALMVAAGMVPLVLSGGRYRLDLPGAAPNPPTATAASPSYEP